MFRFLKTFLGFIVSWNFENEFSFVIVEKSVSNYCCCGLGIIAMRFLKGFSIFVIVKNIPKLITINCMTII